MDSFVLPAPLLSTSFLLRLVHSFLKLLLFSPLFEIFKFIAFIEFMATSMGIQLIFQAILFRHKYSIVPQLFMFSYICRINQSDRSSKDPIYC